MGLSEVTPERIAETGHTFSVFLYGGPKAGKTVGACSAPGPVRVVNAETLVKSLRFARRTYGAGAITEYEFEGRETLADAYELARSQPGGTWIFDSLPRMYQKMLEERSGGP